MTQLDRITFNPLVMAGRACIRGYRIPVSLVVNLVANGSDAAEIIKEYPELELEDVRQALQYAASLTAERETAYLLKSDAMRQRLLDAKSRTGGTTLEDACAQLGI